MEKDSPREESYLANNNKSCFELNGDATNTPACMIYLEDILNWRIVVTPFKLLTTIYQKQDVIASYF